MDYLLYFRINEVVGDYFLIVFVVEQRFYAFERQVSFTVSIYNQVCLYRFIRDVVVVVNTRDFFNQIFFNFYIETLVRRNCLLFVFVFGYFVVETTQNVSYLFIRNMMVDQAIQFVTTQSDGCTFRQRCFVGDINYRVSFIIVDVDQQTGRTFYRFVLQCRINVTFITVRRIGMQVMTTSTIGDRQRVKERVFQQYVLCFVIYVRVFVIEDVVYRQRFVVVGDDQSVSIQFRFSIVEQYQRFVFFRYSYYNVVFNAIFIESVYRLVQFEQYIVGDVNNCIDRTDFVTTQFFFYLQRSWRFNVNVFYYTVKITRVGFRRFDCNRQRVVDGRINRNDFRLNQRQLVQYGNVTRNINDV